MKSEIMLRKNAILLFIILINLFSCNKDNEGKAENKKGTLKGTIELYYGNCMPGPGAPPCQTIPIATTLAITKPSYKFNLSLLIDSINSSGSGTFEIKLPEGNYSLFICDGSEFVCNKWSYTDNCYCRLFKIKQDSTTIVNAYLDHAVY
jgi:hypothetical protein